jgi:hypothetical protein
MASLRSHLQLGGRRQQWGSSGLSALAGGGAFEDGASLRADVSRFRRGGYWATRATAIEWVKDYPLSSSHDPRGSYWKSSLRSLRRPSVSTDEAPPQLIALVVAILPGIM